MLKMWNVHALYRSSNQICSLIMVVAIAAAASYKMLYLYFGNGSASLIAVLGGHIEHCVLWKSCAFHFLCTTLLCLQMALLVAFFNSL